MKRIYLIDCPGVVPPNGNDTEQDILLRGVVRVENVENPEQYIPAVLAKCKPQHIERTYSLKGFKDHIEFLELLARKAGRLLHGGEPDVDGVAKMVINDFLRGKIPWYTPPPKGEEEVAGVDGKLGRLGEMGSKRKREDKDETETVGDVSMVDNDEFGGFSDDGMPDSDSEVEGEEQDDEDDDSEDDEEGGAELEDDEDSEVDAEEAEDDEDSEDDDEEIAAQLAETMKKLREAKEAPTSSIPAAKRKRTQK
jgi:nuclear GTP-binding protein